MSGQLFCGFIAGENENGIVENCDVSGQINVRTSGSCYAAGLVGYGGIVVKSNNVMATMPTITILFIILLFILIFPL